MEGKIREKENDKNTRKSAFRFSLQNAGGGNWVYDCKAPRSKNSFSPFVYILKQQQQFFHFFL